MIKKLVLNNTFQTRTGPLAIRGVIGYALLDSGFVEVFGEAEMIRGRKPETDQLFQWREIKDISLTRVGDKASGCSSIHVIPMEGTPLGHRPSKNLPGKRFYRNYPWQHWINKDTNDLYCDEFHGNTCYDKFKIFKQRLPICPEPISSFAVYHDTINWYAYALAYTGKVYINNMYRDNEEVPWMEWMDASKYSPLLLDIPLLKQIECTSVGLCGVTLDGLYWHMDSVHKSNVGKHFQHLPLHMHWNYEKGPVQWSE